MNPEDRPGGRPGGRPGEGTNGGARQTVVLELSLVDTDFKNHRRAKLDREAVASLAASIEKYGPLEPPLVRPHPERPGRYQVVYGNRRHAAHLAADRTRIEVFVREGLTDTEARRLQAVENLQRESWSPVEEADAIFEMVHKDRLSRKAVAEALGLDRSEVTRRLQLLELSPLVQGQIHTGSVTPGHGAVLYRHLKGDEESQALFAGRVKREELSVKTLERYVKEHLAGEEEDEDLVEERVPNMGPTPTATLAFAEGHLPPEGAEISASPEQRARYVRLGAAAALMAFNDQELRDELGVALPALPAVVDGIFALVDAMEPSEAEALLFRAVRRFFEAGHRKPLIGGSLIAAGMVEGRSSPPPGAAKAGMG